MLDSVEKETAQEEAEQDERGGPVPAAEAGAAHLAEQAGRSSS